MTACLMKRKPPIVEEESTDDEEVTEETTETIEGEDTSLDRLLERAEEGESEDDNTEI